MGERRYRASKIAGKKIIPSIVRTYEKNDVLEVQIIENLQRKDVEPTKEAEAIAYLNEKYSSSEIEKKYTEKRNKREARLQELIAVF